MPYDTAGGNGRGDHRGKCGHRPRDGASVAGTRGDSGVGREGGDFSREFVTEPKAVVMQIAH